MELLLGAGKNHTKRLIPRERPKEWEHLMLHERPGYTWADESFTLCDLEVLPYPWATDTFEEVHAYEVLEHTGAQGDYRFFFAQMTEFWRILKPGGYLCATCPSWRSPWAWGDPSHKRVINVGTLSFLDQENYKQVGRTAMSDFRDIWRADFQVAFAEESAESLVFMLRAVKPARDFR